MSAFPRLLWLRKYTFCMQYTEQIQELRVIHIIDSMQLAKVATRYIALNELLVILYNKSTTRPLTRLGNDHFNLLCTKQSWCLVQVERPNDSVLSQQTSKNLETKKQKNKHNGYSIRLMLFRSTGFRTHWSIFFLRLAFDKQTRIDTSIKILSPIA